MAIGTIIGQAIGMMFGIFMMYYTFLNYKRKQFTGNEFVFWTALWIVFITIALFPGILNPLLPLTGALRALDLLTIVGFAFLIFSVFYNYTLTRRNQRQLEAIVSNLAISKRKK
ncbi:MAG TPA: DUF2304 domain-containing protein [Candidatus Nanoarchaeia archaeon]|nr:DUF2304 domain-containing protein [Candidatus Nanoarchaeia archaeon]